MQPKVSIIIPCFNQGHFLEEAIKSCLKQTYKNIEIIVINDASPDNTEEICKKYKDKIVYIKNKKNLASAGARNRGINKATGDYVAFLDADDIMFPWAVKASIETLEENPHINFSYGDYFIFSESTHSLQFIKTPNFNSLKFLRDPGILTGGVMIRRMVFDSVLYDEKLLRREDFDFYRRMSLKYAGIRIVLPLYKYRYHTQTRIHEQGEEYKGLMKFYKKKQAKLIKKLPSHNYKDLHFKPKKNLSIITAIWFYKILCLPREIYHFLKS